MSRFASVLVVALPGLVASPAASRGATEFCLSGKLDIGLRLQGTEPEAGEWVATTWCVVTEDDSSRVMYSASGKANPDMDDSWAVAYLPPDTVRILNRQAPPDVEFRGTGKPQEAASVRRLDPQRLLEELRTSTQGLEGVEVRVEAGRVIAVETTADFPLRGRVGIDWHWEWTDPSRPELLLTLDDRPLFEAVGRWRDVSADEAATVWTATPGADPITVPGDRWPARIDMQRIHLTDAVSLVRGVRTGFQHLVVDTEQGLVIADAPAGWVELHHIPPRDLVPGLGVSGLSEKLLDFLGEEFPGRTIAAVVVTHFHDDHAGGARAFAAAGAKIYASQESARFLESALNASSNPPDRLAAMGESVVVTPVEASLTLGDKPNRVVLLPMGKSPHVSSMLGVWLPDQDYLFVSDVHVPRSDAAAPAEGRAATECWFSRWAVASLPPATRVLNSHSAETTPISRLHQYLESAACRSPSDR